MNDEAGRQGLIRTIWRIAAPYFRSEERWAGRGLLGAIIAIELAIVGITVMINQWNARFYNALQDRNLDSFTSELLFFALLAAIYIGLAVYQVYLNQWLDIRWRRWMTSAYLERWLNEATHYRMQIAGDVADNPDQRIADDIRLFIEKTLGIGIGLLNAVVTLMSFAFILWGLSEAAPLTIFGESWNIPGYLLWAALIYSMLGTLVTHWIGSPLVPLNFNQQRYEADFRFHLVRVRENAEQIALSRGEAMERAQLGQRFGTLAANWFAIMSRQKKLTAFTASFSQISVIFPFIVVAPAYFASKIQLGALMQTASAFSKVQESLSFFVTIYRQLAEWQAVIQRLDGFERAIMKAKDQQARTALTISRNVAQEADATTDTIALHLDDLVLHLPDGTKLISADDIKIESGAKVLLTGPSGSGKSTLFRALAGIWPFGSGQISIPHGASLMMLPQKPYLPVGALRDALSYPAPGTRFSVDELQAALEQSGLAAFKTRLDDHDNWGRTLSPGEQQRLAFARVLLHKPDFLFLDEATASLDEASEAKLYGLLAAMPDLSVISIGHRATLSAFHSRTITAAPLAMLPGETGKGGAPHRITESTQAF